MRKVTVLSAAALLTLGLASSAEASLIFVNDISITGTGLGAVNTLVTVHDSVGGQPDPTVVEGGCVQQSGADGPPCLGEVTENDNIALNQTFTFDTTLNFVAVVNISETGVSADGEPSATLTGLYLNFCSTTAPATCHLAEWFEANKVLATGEGTGLGASGFTFRLTDAEFALVQGLPGDFVKVSGGLQFLGGTTNDGNETLHLLRIQGNQVVPEPASLALFGMAVAAGLVRRRRAGR